MIQCPSPRSELGLGEDSQDTHTRMQRDIHQQVTIIPKGIHYQHILIARKPKPVTPKVGFDRNNKDLTEGKCDALTHFISIVHIEIPPGITEVVPVWLLKIDVRTVTTVHEIPVYHLIIDLTDLIKLEDTVSSNCCSSQASGIAAATSCISSRSPPNVACDRNREAATSFPSSPLP